MDYINTNWESLLAQCVSERTSNVDSQNETKNKEARILSRCPYKQKGLTTTYESLNQDWHYKFSATKWIYGELWFP